MKAKPLGLTNTLSLAANACQAKAASFEKCRWKGKAKLSLFKNKHFYRPHLAHEK